jgi:hypothetical protein
LKGFPNPVSPAQKAAFKRQRSFLNRYVVPEFRRLTLIVLLTFKQQSLFDLTCQNCSFGGESENPNMIHEGACPIKPRFSPLTPSSSLTEVELFSAVSRKVREGGMNKETASAEALSLDFMLLATN